MEIRIYRDDELVRLAARARWLRRNGFSPPQAAEIAIADLSFAWRTALWCLYPGKPPHEGLT